MPKPRQKGSTRIRNRETAPVAAVAAPVPGVKDVPALQAPADKNAALIRGGTTSGTPGQIVRFWNRWRENYNALTALTLRRVRELNEMTQRGDHAYPQWTYRTIGRRHPILKALIDCCEAPLENVKWDVRIKEQLPEGFNEGDAKKQQAKLKAAYGQIDNLREALKHLSHADFSGYALCQKHELDGEVVHLECLLAFCICRDGLFGDWFWNPDSRALTMPEYVLTAKNRIGGDTLPRQDFVIREVERPINEIALENFVRRKLIEKDWSAFDEIFGLPSGVLIMPAGIPPEKVSEYEASAKEIAEGGTGAAPNGSDWKPNQPPHDGSVLFKSHMSQLDEDLVLAGTGGKLKMLVEHAAGGAGGGGGGNVRGSSKTQDDTFMQIAMARGNDVAQQFHRDFDVPFLAQHFSAQPALVEFFLNTEDQIDVTALCTNAATLKQAGKNINTQYIADQTGYTFDQDDPAPPAPKPGEENNFPPGSPEDVAAKKKLALKNRYPGAPVPARVVSHFAASLADDLQPLRSAIAAIENISDPKLFQTKLEEFISDHGPLVKLLADINAYPKSAKVLNDLNTDALASALAKPKETITA